MDWFEKQAFSYSLYCIFFAKNDIIIADPLQRFSREPESIQTMYRPAPIAFIILCWIIAEYVAFLYIVSLVGLSGALLIGVATFLIGLNAIKRLGGAALANLRQQMNRDKVSANVGLGEVIQSFGALLLIIPGFMSDLVGLALLTPSLGQWLLTYSDRNSFARTAESKGQNQPDIIDLDASHWRRVDEKLDQKDM